LNFKQFVVGIGGYSSKSVRIGGLGENRKYWMSKWEFSRCWWQNYDL